MNSFVVFSLNNMVKMLSIYLVYILGSISLLRPVSNILTNQLAKGGAMEIPWKVHSFVWTLDHWRQIWSENKFLSMFLNVVFVIFNLVNIEEFSFECTSLASMFIVSPNGTQRFYQMFYENKIFMILCCLKNLQYVK